MSEEKEVKGKNKLNLSKVNEVVTLSHKVLRIFYILLFIISVYVVIKVAQELDILKFIIDILTILVPLFIGLIVSWLFNPFVTFLQKKGVKRIFSVIFVYILLIGAIALIVGSILPILYDQIVGFAETVPNLFKDIEGVINKFLNNFSNIDGIDIEGIKLGVINHLENIGGDLSSDLPQLVINLIRSLISGISTFAIGMIIGFFLLLKSSNLNDVLIGFVPERWRYDLSDLVNKINGSLRNYILGVIIDALVIFVVCSLAFSLIGLRAPLLFAVFCAITNVIPYIGPYIGAVPALIVAFSMNPTIGILVLIAIVVIQFIEGNFLQEYIMSKTTKLHPVTIITGLLVFGHYWGMIGMVASTPIISVFKQVILFLDKKYHFFSIGGEVDE